MSAPSRRGIVALVAGLLAVGAALGLPERSTPSSTPDDAALRLQDVWPRARTITVPGQLADGSSYVPFVIIDESTSVGLASDIGADGQVTNRLVLQRTDRPPRLLRSYEGAAAPWFVAQAVADDQVYWLESGTSDGGELVTTLWHAGLAAAAAAMLASDDSDVRYYDSMSDLIIADGQIHWMAAERDGGSAMRSVPLGGGTVSSRELDRPYAFVSWPWVTTATGNGPPGPAVLYNLVTGQTRTVASAPDEILECTLVWCRVTTVMAAEQRVIYDLRHPDGSGTQRLSDDTAAPLNGDVALMDRFEVLGAVSPEVATFVQSIWLYDLATQRRILLSGAGSGGVHSANGYLWWSTGDNEALVWHVLDLRELD